GPRGVRSPARGCGRPPTGRSSDRHGFVVYSHLQSCRCHRISLSSHAFRTISSVYDTDDIVRLIGNDVTRCRTPPPVSRAKTHFAIANGSLTRPPSSSAATGRRSRSPGSPSTPAWESGPSTG